MRMDNVIEKGKKGNWVDLGSDTDYRGKPKGKRRTIPQHVLRQIAHERKDGGTAMCWVCKTWFAMYYIRRVHVAAFEIEFVCCDCKKSRGYVNAD